MGSGEASIPLPRRVLITGASHGIGRATARLLASKGCEVGLVARSREDLAALAAELKAEHGGTAMALPCDLRDAKAVESAIGEFAEGRNGLDAVVHAAAQLGELTRIDKTDPSVWAETIDVNLNGSFYVAYTASRAMQAFRKSREGAGAAGAAGRLLLVSSSVGRQPRSPWGAYSVSKVGMEALMQLLAMEAAHTRVLAASVNPGGTATAMRARAYPDENPATLPSPEQVARALAHCLCLPDEQFNGHQFNARDWL